MYKLILCLFFILIIVYLATNCNNSSNKILDNGLSNKSDYRDDNLDTSHMLSVVQIMNKLQKK